MRAEERWNRGKEGRHGGMEKKTVHSATRNNAFALLVTKVIFLVENGFLKVKSNLYQIILEPTYSDDKLSLFLYTAENHKRYFLKIKDNRLQIFLATRNPEFHMQFDSTDEIVYEKTIK